MTATMTGNMRILPSTLDSDEQRRVLESALNVLLEPLDQVCCSFFEDHAVYSEYDGVVADLDQTRGMVEALGDNRALILANHGLNIDRISV